MKTRVILFALVSLVVHINALPSEKSLEADGLKYRAKRSSNVKSDVSPDEQNADYWTKNAKTTLKSLKSIETNTGVAKNVILFLGDGMSVPTLAATRVYLGGEENSLSFDEFPHTALSKTYCVDYQVADSACTATAYLTGVKANMGTIGVSAQVGYEDCESMANKTNHVYSIGKWFQSKGRKVGVVSTASITDASPAGVYAHTAQRDWESDTDLINAGIDPTKCRDIAYQLIHNEESKDFNVILGGGRKNFLPSDVQDEEGNNGVRSDGLNLINEWKDSKKNDNKTAEYVYNRDGLLNLDNATEYVLGLFTYNHMPYNLDRDKDVVPSLEELTEAAINVLSRNNEEGYFIFIEGARIDDAHHEAKAQKALEETVEFSKAIAKAVNMTSESDTLIVVTADHAHTLSYSGYALRHNNILTYPNDETDADGDKFLTLNYANGPGYKPDEANSADDCGFHRHDVGQDDTTDKDYEFPAVFPLTSETHGGDDVVIFARGPWAHLYAGVLEQNVIPHIMAHASCVGDDNENPSCYPASGGSNVFVNTLMVCVATFFAVLAKI